jgi:hypothetical protein
METKLNDNEVREIASMQKMIDSYKSFVFAINFMIESGEDINCPIFCNMDRKMRNVWKWVKEHKDNK